MDSQGRKARLSPAFPRVRVAWILAFIVLVILIPISHASDDANSGDFSSKPQAVAPPSQPNSGTVDQTVATGLQKLNAGSNNTQVTRLVSDLENHNYTDAQSTVQSLRAELHDPSSPASSQLSTGLKDVLQSTSCTTVGCSVDWSNVSNMVQPYSTDQLGIPQGLSGTSPGSAASQLSILSNMAGNADPNLSLLFGSEANQILQFLDSSQTNSGPIQQLPNPLSNPSLGSVPPLSGTAGAFGVAPRALGGIPDIFSGIGNPTWLVLIPVAAVLSGLIAYTLLRRKSIGQLWKKRILGGLKLEGGLIPSANLDPDNPRHAIILNFGRAVGLMLGRGVLKMPFETHREFSAKCEARPEMPYVGRISSLYERAVFSGRNVNQGHVDDSRKQVTLIQECEPNKE